MLLPDINVWLALTFQSHAHHPAAKTWFDALPDSAACCFCRLTQQGFLRLATNRKVFGKEAVTLHEAWQNYDYFLSDQRVTFINDPPDIETHWRAYTQGRSFSPSVWNDAYLAALALTTGMEVITFDKGFAQFLIVRSTILTG